jgi:acyl-CoA oxidase
VRDLTPVIRFRTQQILIFTGLAQAYVLHAFEGWAVESFREHEEDLRVRHGIAVCFKVAAVQICQADNLAISDCCGAQGLFEHNQMSVLHVSRQLPENHNEYL